MKPIPASQPKQRGVFSASATWFFALVIEPFLLLALLELVLRAMGYGHSMDVYLDKELDGRVFHILNKAFYQEFDALPVDDIVPWHEFEAQIPAQKCPNAYRIFVLGGSAAHGTPEYSLSFPRILEVMLDRRFPKVRIEVYNVAFPGTNSHVMREVARASAGMQPDLFVIYMGNNELDGPYGPLTLDGVNRVFLSLPLIRAHMALRGLRTVQSCMGSMAGLWHMPYEDAVIDGPERSANEAIAYAHYRANLGAICDYAASAGAGVVLCTLGANADFGSILEAPPAWAKQYRYESDSRTALNEILAEIAIARAQSGVGLADVAHALAESTSSGTGGYDLFYDDVHFTFYGGYVAARTVFAEVARALPGHAGPREEPPPQAPAKSDCALALAWTPAAQLQQVENVLNSNMLGYAEARQIWQRRLDALSAEVGPDWRAELAEGYRGSLELSAPDYSLRYRYAESLLSVGKVDEALAQARLLVERFPYRRGSRRTLASALGAAGHSDAAIAHLRKTLAEYPDDYRAYVDLGLACQRAGRPEAALEAYHKALAINPTDQVTWCAKAEALLELNDLTGAIDACREAISFAPHYTPAYERLEAALVRQGDVSQRIAEWRRMLEARPDVTVPHLYLAGALEAKGDVEGAIEAYREAGKGVSLSAEAQLALARLLAAKGDFEEAARSYRTIIAADPDVFSCYGELDSLLIQRADTGTRIAEWRRIVHDYPEAGRAYFHLGMALEEAGEADGMIAAYRKAGELNPFDAAVQAHLGLALVQAGRFSEAIGALSKALELNPDITDLRPYFIEALCATGNYRAARAETAKCYDMGVALPRDLEERVARGPAQTP